MIFRAILVAVLLAGHASAAQAAVVSNIQGNVSVNKGQGPLPTAAATEVLPGHAVQAGADGGAIIFYENGCVREVKPNETVIIPANPQCSTGFDSTSTTAIVVGGAVVGGAIAAVAASSGGGSPASP